MMSFTSLVIIFISLFLFHSATSQSIVKTLPGFSGDLPFKLETGYITVGRNDDIELFYYFIESERNPKEDPLILWFNGGPGCTGLYGLAFEIGPIAFDTSSFNGSLPSFVLREPSWTKIANIIFLDQPVGAGYSYGTQADSYNSSDTLAAKDNYIFLRKWLLNHPEFIENDLYVAGDSYGGKLAPMVALEISNGNEAGLKPHLSLKGYLIGNAMTDEDKVHNEQIPYAYGMGLISAEYYELAKSRCSGEYMNPDPNNVQCLKAIQLVKDCIRDISTFMILEPSCTYAENKRGVSFLEENSHDNLLLLMQENRICHADMASLISQVWANNQEVQDALYVRKGTIKDWKRCNTSNPGYVKDVEDAVTYHQALIGKIPKAMIYSGDHDIEAPYIAPLKMIKKLNLTIDDRWRPWYVNGEVAGYTQRYTNYEHHLTFATVKGAGHTAPEYKPEQCLAMVDRWFNSNPL